MQHSGLAVVEARWWHQGNDSVRPLFETLCGIAINNPFGFRYDMFSDEGSFTTVVSQIASVSDYHTLYIAAHGNDREIQASPGCLMSRTKVRNYVRNANQNHTLTGLYFGSCMICNEGNAAFFLDTNNGCNVNWIGGYSKPVDWITSSSVDMMFWSYLLEERRKNRSRRRNKKSDLEMAKVASSEMKRVMPTVFNELGFNLYHLDGGQNVVSVW